MKLRNHSTLRLEHLERRDAPATLVNPSTVTYQDVDGDNVTVKVSKGTLATANFVFDKDFDWPGPQQLGWLVLTNPEFQDAAVTIAAVQSAANGGDGFANVGWIAADGIDLGTVNVDGDLGRIEVGDSTLATTGLKSLTAQSLGQFGISTGALILTSDIEGKLGALTIKSDIVEAFVNVTGGADGKIGKIIVGGTLIGGAATNSGSIVSSGDMGAVLIRGDVIGAAGSHSGKISSGAAIPGGVKVGGSLIGGLGDFSGQIFSVGNLGPVKIGGNVQGGVASLLGGGGIESGRIFTNSALARVTVGGSLVGGSNTSSGQIFSVGNLGPVKIGGNIQWGVASLFNTGGNEAGVIATNSALAGVTVGGSLVGGSKTSSGQIFSVGNLGPVKINGNVQGGEGTFSGRIATSSALAGVTVGGSLVGSTGLASGQIFSVGNLGPVKITGNVQGGDGDTSGHVSTDGTLASVTLGGSLIGGSNLFSSRSGEIFSKGNLGPVKITGDVVGGSIILVFSTGSLSRSGYIQGQRIASVFVGGSIVAGTNPFHYVPSILLTKSGSIRAMDDLGPITVKGSLIGNSTNPVIISARGQAAVVPNATTDVAIKSLTVDGRVQFANILAGYSVDLNPLNADAQIGTVAVGLDWIAGNLAAGVVAGADQYFGSGDDTLIAEVGGDDPNIVAKIARIVIKGQALGTPGGVDRFGYVAQEIGSLVSGGTAFGLTAGKSNDTSLTDPLLAVGATGDLRVREVL